MVNRLQAGRVVEDALAERERQQQKWDRWGDEFAGAMIGLLGDYNRAQRGERAPPSPVPPPPPSGGSGGGTARGKSCNVLEAPALGSDVFYVVWDGDETGSLYTVYSYFNPTERQKREYGCSSARSCFEGFLKTINPRMRIEGTYSSKAEAVRAANAKCGR